MTKADGTKFGKTEGGAIWLDPALTRPYAFYQFWVNADDRDVARLPAVLQLPSREEIEELEKATAERPAARAAQRALAERADHAGARRGGDAAGRSRPSRRCSGAARWTSSAPATLRGRAGRGRAAPGDRRAARPWPRC